MSQNYKVDSKRCGIKVCELLTIGRILSITILKDTTTGETYRIHICYKCDPETYPTGKPIDITDTYARKEKDGSWTCGECVIEDLNKRKLRVFGPDHKDVKAFIQKENADCKRWNNYVKSVNQTMGAGLKYKKNRYTGKIPFGKWLVNLLFLTLN